MRPRVEASPQPPERPFPQSGGALIIAPAGPPRRDSAADSTMRTAPLPALLVALLLLAAAQHVSGLKELAGAEIQGNDMCPPGVKQQAAPAPPPPAPRTSSSLTRLFSGSSSSKPPSRTAQEAGTRAPACRLAYKHCGDVVAVAERCKQTLGCRAFTYDGRCGYLKSAEGPRTARRGWSTYIV